VALLEPFIDTIVVCTMTALAILSTKAHLVEGAEGVGLTFVAFKQLGGVEDILLCTAIFTFAWSTVLGWGYYGERGTEYLAGARSNRIACSTSSPSASRRCSAWAPCSTLRTCCC
jgi:AGCS family alanine or glycine:cation symporter